MATFTTTFPPSPSGASASVKPLRILYADDMHELREVVRLTLDRDGHRIECVENGDLAFHRLQADSGFNLVITDHHMPVMNGLEFVTHLRAAASYRGKIMVFSSEISPGVEAEYRRLGVDRILYKPVFPTALRAVLAEVFS